MIPAYISPDQSFLMQNSEHFYGLKSLAPDPFLSAYKGMKTPPLVKNK